jgi:hypothetical protein
MIEICRVYFGDLFEPSSEKGVEVPAKVLLYARIQWHLFTPAVVHPGGSTVSVWSYTANQRRSRRNPPRVKVDVADRQSVSPPLDNRIHAEQGIRHGL